MNSLKIKWMKSTIGCTQNQRDTIKSLGFRRLYQEKTLKNTPEIRGMVRKVLHLIKIVEDVH